MRYLVDRCGGWRNALTVVGAAAILGGGALLRLHGINQYGLNSDEAVYAGQAAGLAGFTHYSQLFGLFRAHPLLVQLLVSFAYRLTGVSGLVARDVCAGFGVALILVVGIAGRVLWGRLAALIGMLFVAVSPYPIAVSRQMLLDGPEAFFVALTVLLLCVYVKRPRRELLWAAAFAGGLAFLSKESAILLVPAVLVFFIVSPKTLPRYRDLVIAGAIYVLTILPYPLAELSAGKVSTGADYLVWQVLRPANHPLDFYFGILGAIGWAIVGLALIGGIVAFLRRSPVDILLLTVILVIFGFLEAWPTKGYEYLLPLIAPLALLAVSGALQMGTALARLFRRRSAHPERHRGMWVPAGLAVVAAGTIFLTASPIVNAQQGASNLVGTDSGQPAVARVTVLAGSGGLLAGRPTGLWVKSHILAGSEFLTIGPTFANILEFYSQDRALALSVSPNPLHRNPSYSPVDNADLLIRSGAIQYLVYDAYSAARSAHFADRVLALARKFHGVLVYQYDQTSSTGRHRALVRVYEVQP
ncbi:MAG TPA: glycosyltransferase family 39 protein [Candidatus Dormibacteraeota bacterium]|nr:glycosyltransferase family 39 protein [Candidatus Dormibacteraeota bacterium]